MVNTAKFIIRFPCGLFKGRFPEESTAFSLRKNGVIPEQEPSHFVKIREKGTVRPGESPPPVLYQRRQQDTRSPGGKLLPGHEPGRIYS